MERTIWFEDLSGLTYDAGSDSLGQGHKKGWIHGKVIVFSFFTCSLHCKRVVCTPETLTKTAYTKSRSHQVIGLYYIFLTRLRFLATFYRKIYHFTLSFCTGVAMQNVPDSVHHLLAWNTFLYLMMIYLKSSTENPQEKRKYCYLFLGWIFELEFL